MNETISKGGSSRNCLTRITTRWLLILVVLIGTSTSELSWGAASTLSRREPADSSPSADKPVSPGVSRPKETIPTEVYFLKNQDPVQLAEVLGRLVQGPATEERIVIAPDTTTHSLLVRASRQNEEWIARLIGQLDKPRPQVLIDCTLVEVMKNDVFSYDLYALKNSHGPVRPPSLTPAEPNAFGPSARWGCRGLTAFYDDGQIQALLDTLCSKKCGRILAKPKLIVRDHQKGTVEVKETIYAKVAAGKYHPCDAGMTLELTPHIIDDDILQLDIVLTRSDFLKHTATQPPDTVSSRVDATVAFPNADTVILGGMLKSKQRAKVPILGDIPLMGGLFRRANEEDTRSTLCLFVRAEILGPPEHKGRDSLTILSQRNREAFERHELEFQSHQEWPGLKPKRVTPGAIREEP